MAFNRELLRELELQGREMVGCCPPVEQRDLRQLPEEDLPVVRGKGKKRVEQPGGCWHMIRDECSCGASDCPCRNGV